MHLFKRGWIASGHGDSTYGLIPYIVPNGLTNPSPDFAWLDGVSPAMEKVIRENSTLFSTYNELQSWPAISKQIQERNLLLPATFTCLIESPELQRKIPTCTDCFLSLSEALIPLPGADDHFLLRFLNDSQSCVMWYLCLSPQREPWVIASPYFFETDIFAAMEYQDVNADMLVAESYLCAETFLEFIHRFWQENVLWFSEHKI